ncbi:hypothetical protein O6H91_06G016200 [Diphasiastrum complanatum]|uniref:Uncharacterized protein n=2 Tax=Diphasiastrum complanatum TaxID=34168 RepID=A0ACC2DAV0_DIPCM|nr:hypothetical protein O6H91_06G016200 [Diphasiastrum complanatum]KAJ7551459.1 hypothetical protein O6H91_06G016200 [Diphasiastrum complanatum]
MSLAKDIAKRFELLENQWLNFQERAATWEIVKETSSVTSSEVVSCSSSSVQGDSKTSKKNHSVSPSPVSSLRGAPVGIIDELTSKSSFVLPAIMQEEAIDFHSIDHCQMPQLERTNSSLQTGKSSSQVNLETCSIDSGTPLGVDALLNFSHRPNGSCSQFKLSGCGSNEFRHYSFKKRSTSECLPADAVSTSGSEALSPDKGISELRIESPRLSNLANSQELSPLHESRSPPPDLASSEEFHARKVSCNKRSFMRSSLQRRLHSRDSREHSLRPDNISKPKSDACKSDPELEGSSHVSSRNDVMQKLCADLKNVVFQLEIKEASITEALKELKGASIGTSEWTFHGEPGNFGYEASLEGLSLLAEEVNPENWPHTIESICERLIMFLNKETHLQKWAISLEKEALRILKLEEGVIEAKALVAEEKEKVTIAMKKAEEHSQNAKEEHLNLVKERESLFHWVTHLQERREAVTECEREAALSLAEVQKRAANVFVRESLVDEKALEIVALQDTLKLTAQRFQDDEELLAKERKILQEKFSHLEEKDKETQSQMTVIKKMQQDLDTQIQQYEMEKLNEAKIRDKAAISNRQWEEKINAKEKVLKEQEHSLEDKSLEIEALSQKVAAREKLLNIIQKKTEEERLYNQREQESLDRDRTSLEEASRKMESSKKNAEDFCIRASKEREQVSEFMHSMEEKFKSWEKRLVEQEKDLLQQQNSLTALEKKLHTEQEQCTVLHSKLIREQETMKIEMGFREEGLTNRAGILEVKENEVRKEFETLSDERKLAVQELKQLTEMKAEIQIAEKELKIQKQKHSQEVLQHAKQYEMHIEDLEDARQDLELKSSEVERQFEELQMERQELQLWQRAAEESLERQIQSLIKEKEEIQPQKQKLRKLQLEIEQVGAQMFGHFKDIEEASTKLESQRHKIDSSYKKLQALFENLAGKQLHLKHVEKDLLLKEDILKATQGELMKMAVDASVKEKNFQTREQAMIDKEKELHDIESRLGDEKNESTQRIHELDNLSDFINQQSKALTQAEQALATEKASFHKATETKESYFKKEKQSLSEAWEALSKKEKNLAAYEADLNNREHIIDEKSCALSKLELEEYKRSHKAEQLENNFLHLENGWRKLRDEECALENEKDMMNVARSELQKQQMDLIKRRSEHHQEQGGAVWRERLRNEVEKHYQDIVELTASLHARESALALREDQAREKESVLTELEQGEGQMETDLHKLQHQLRAAHTELEAQRCYAEGRRKVAEVTAASLQQREVKLREREQEVKDREKILKMLEARVKLSLESRSTIVSPAGSREKSYCASMGALNKFEEALPTIPITDKLYLMSLVSEQSNNQATQSEPTAASQKETERMMLATEQHDCIIERHSPSKARLDNVMTSLINAREASRSRLHRTENALSSLPSSLSSTAEVKRALNALAARLNFLDQIEEGLASQLRKAYESDTPELEGIIVDKVQLLCRMEEQQSLRAEWEEDMQQQLERISVLQATFSVRKQGKPHSKDCSPLAARKVGGFLIDEDLQEQCFTGFDANNEELDKLFPVSVNATGLSEGMYEKKHTTSPTEWHMAVEAFPKEIVRGVSISPLADYSLISSTKQHPQSGKQQEESRKEQAARRRLLLTSPKGKYMMQCD